MELNVRHRPCAPTADRLEIVPSPPDRSSPMRYSTSGPRVTGRRMPFDQLKPREFITLGGRASATCPPVLACACRIGSAMAHCPTPSHIWPAPSASARSARLVGPPLMEVCHDTRCQSASSGSDVARTREALVGAAAARHLRHPVRGAYLRLAGNNATHAGASLWRLRAR